MESTHERTVKYIKEHPYIQSCLASGLINYSSLAREIQKELGLKNKTSMEAILIAARRYQLTLKGTKSNQIKNLLADSELAIKNKFAVFVFEKDMTIFKKLEHDEGYLLEGTNSYTLIVPEKKFSLIEKKFGKHIISKKKDLALVTLTSPKEIENIPGVISYLTSLFSENGVNIEEFFSCWRDTVFVIAVNDLGKVLEFLHFS